jgi:anti-sigma B factor antagonist
MTTHPHLTAAPVQRHELDGSVRLTRLMVGRRTVLCAAGEIDCATVPEFTAAIEAALTDGALELWIDLTRTTFMESSGLHALLAAQRQVGELKRRLAVICPGGAVLRLFDVARVSGSLPIHADRAAAHRGMH